jgi:hypothetical protein
VEAPVSDKSWKLFFFLSSNTKKKGMPIADRGGSRDSVVGIATSYGLDDRRVGVRVPVGSRIFSSPNRPDRL